MMEHLAGCERGERYSGSLVTESSEPNMADADGDDSVFYSDAAGTESRRHDDRSVEPVDEGSVKRDTRKEVNNTSDGGAARPEGLLKESEMLLPEDPGLRGDQGSDITPAPHEGGKKHSCVQFINAQTHTQGSFSNYSQVSK